MGTVHAMKGPGSKYQPPVDGGGGGPHDRNMELRVDRLERVVERCETDLTAIKVSVAKIETRLDNVATKTWVMAGAIGVLVALIGGFWWIAQQYLAPILAAAGKH